MPSSKPRQPVPAAAGPLLRSLGLSLCALVQLCGCAMAPEQLAYRQRLEAGVQTPEDTLRFKTSPAEQQQLVASAPEWPNAGSAASARGPATDASLALQQAAHSGELSATRAALLRGAPVDGRGAAMTPLAVAALGGHTEVVKLLLSKGARPDTSTEAGESALTLAVRLNRVPVAAALLQAGASLDVHTRQGDSLVMVAISENFSAMLALLLQHGASPNAPDRDGLTPLYWATYLQHDGLVQQLLAAGAAPQVTKLALPGAGSYSLGEF